jgi:hypothetical protein
MLNENETMLLLSKALFIDYEFAEFNHSHIQLKKASRLVITLIDSNIETENSFFTSSSDNKDDEMFNLIQSINVDSSADKNENDSNDNLKAEVSIARCFDAKKSKCLCKNIDLNLLQRLRCKNVETSDIKTETECFEVLRRIIKCHFNEIAFRHVYHKHLHAFADNFKLQMKMLNSMSLRTQFKQC